MPFRPPWMRPPLADRLSASMGACEASMVADAQLRMVWQHSRTGMAIAALFALLLTQHLQQAMHAGALHAWLGLKLAVSTVRWFQANRFARLTGPVVDPRWRSTSLLTLAIDASVWGALGAWAVLQGTTTAAVVVASLLGVASVASFGLQVWRSAAVAYVVPIMVPMILALAWRGDATGWLGACGLSLMLSLQLLGTHRSDRNWTESQVLRLNAQRLARDKEAALALASRQSSVKTQFIANVSHELRTPLHGILGLTHLLHGEVQAPAARHRIELIEASGTHLLGLINDLLDVSRIEAGRLTLRAQPFDLVAQIEQVSEVFELHARDRGLRFQRQIDLRRPCWVNGDAQRFRQVLHNLLGNAMKFTDAGTITLTVWRHADATQRVCADVTDTGPGISAEDQTHLFEAFAQFSSAVAQPRAGTGLGLTIAREIARTMGGDILVNSQPGQGSTFKFTADLPACSPPAAPSPTSAPKDDSWMPPPCQVLVADDDDVNVIILTAQLQRLGLQVTRARDGVEAVRLAMSPGNRPALVLMDFHMPVLDGISATRQIRALEHAQRLPPVPVVAMTASLSGLDRQHCLDIGMDELLGKPFNGDQLNQVLRQLLTPALAGA